jgi:hypothetical protein
MTAYTTFETFSAVYAEEKIPALASLASLADIYVTTQCIIASGIIALIVAVSTMIQEPHTTRWSNRNASIQHGIHSYFDQCAHSS